MFRSIKGLCILLCVLIHASACGCTSEPKGFKTLSAVFSDTEFEYKYSIVPSWVCESNTASFHLADKTTSEKDIVFKHGKISEI